MILQRDPRLLPVIRRFGCYLMCIFYIVNKLTNYMFSAKIINHLYSEFVSRGFITTECLVIDPEGIFEYLKMRVEYTGKHEKPDRKCKDGEFEILYFERIKKGGGTQPHFVNGNGEGIVTHDPWGCSRAVREGKLVSKRIFRRLT